MIALRDGHFAAGPFPPLPIHISPTRRGVRLALLKAVEVRNKTLKDRPPLQLPKPLTTSPTSPAATLPPAAAAAAASARDYTNEQQEQTAEKTEDGCAGELGGGLNDRIRERGPSHHTRRRADPSSPADHCVVAEEAMQPLDMDMKG
mmetsp:Transcript_26563/g.76185  ORF Transcript_26563/g.76185 Transcript_26563/m.76185 type:complete len:147 (+) Transcript_26563:677-1117(+)